MTRLSYALVTPVRDDEGNLRRLAGAVAQQSVLPKEWLIVDNGSTDGTPILARQLERRYDWITTISSEGTGAAQPGAPIVRAFNAGVRKLRDASDIVVKLDADVSFEPTYFEEMLRAFADDARLGIASGECLELSRDAWQVRPVTVGHARGATRAYRWECLQVVVPLPERVGWDTVDEVKANVLGWRTGTIPHLCFYHHRSVGERDGAPWSRWVRQGEAAYYLGYKATYLLARTFHRSVRNPAALGMAVGYLTAMARRSARHEDEDVRKHLRERQRISLLPLRAREAFGRVRGSLDF